MKTKKLKIQMNGRPDEFQTPEHAVDILVPYLKRANIKIIWECAIGKGLLADALNKRGFFIIKIYGDFLKITPHDDFDCIVTNPPYSKKDEFLEKAYQMGKPFAFLLPLTALEGKRRQKLYKKYGIQLIIPNKRINFITPSGKGSGAWFQTAWFCWKLNLPQQLNFVEATW